MSVLGERLQLAGLDPSLWPDALGEISAAVDAAGALLLCTENPPHFNGPPASASLASAVDAYVGEGWIARDERARSVPAMLRRGLAVDDDFTTVEERRRSPYYQDFLPRIGVGSFAIVGFKAGDATWGLSLLLANDQRPFTPADLKRLLTLWRPLSDAAALSRQLGFARVLGVTDAFELTRRPALVLDDKGKVLAINGLAESLVGSFLDVTRQTLVFSDQRSQGRYQALIAALCKGVAPAEPNPASTTVLDRRGRSVAIRAIELHGWARFAFTNAKILLLIGVDVPSGDDAAATLRTTFSLTAAESRFAMELLSGRSIAAIADRLGVSYETARSHLRAIFSKTTTHRQGELVALLSQVLR